MTIDRSKLRWNGWGPIDAHDPFAGKDGAWDFIAEALGGGELPTTPAVPFEAAMLPEPLSDDRTAPFRKIVGGDNVSTDSLARAHRARGRSYPDLLALRAGDVMAAPGAVIFPSCTDEIVKILRHASDHAIAVVPFGGGSSVVGGASGAGGRSITIDMTRMTALRDFSPEDRLATFEAGVDGPALEAELEERGFTLGHAPQSFLHSTLGGWIAASGSGQQSRRYGRADDWYVGAEVATPQGVWRTEPFPANAAGPSLGRLVVGSEGALGVIASATVRIKPLPLTKDYRGYVFAAFEAGAGAIRAIVQADVPTAMLRLSDADETKFLSAFSSLGVKPSLSRKIGRLYLKSKGIGEGFCLLIAGFEGEPKAVDAQRSAAERMIRRAGGVPAGRKYGARWLRSRFDGPHMRDPLLDRGVGVDTLETATRWSNLSRLHAAVREALATSIATEPGKRGVVMAHVSHCYPEGASLYFTFLFRRREEDALGQWQAIKKAASDAIMAHGGAITHHHGIGTDHLPWMAAEKGALALDVLRAVKRTLDPAGVLNPGKLVP